MIGIFRANSHRECERPSPITQSAWQNEDIFSVLGVHVDRTKRQLHVCSRKVEPKEARVCKGVLVWIENHSQPGNPGNNWPENTKLFLVGTRRIHIRVYTRSCTLFTRTRNSPGHSRLSAMETRVTLSLGVQSDVCDVSPPRSLYGPGDCHFQRIYIWYTRSCKRALSAISVEYSFPLIQLQPQSFVENVDCVDTIQIG